MNTLSRVTHILAGIFCLHGVVLAQVSGQRTATDLSNQAQYLSAYRAGLSNAKLLAKANDLVAAETALTPLNLTKPNSAEWELETAQRLMQLAEQLAREGQPRNVVALANRALQHLVQAGSIADSARVRAEAKTLAGFIQERYISDRTAALTNYQAAAALSPATARSAKEAATRLQKAEETLRARGKGK